jgi:hypothetical protein
MGMGPIPREERDGLGLEAPKAAKRGSEVSGKGRIVPPHVSGGGMGYWRDPDETRGRALYRALADAEARRQLAYERHRVRLKKDGEQ